MGKKGNDNMLYTIRGTGDNKYSNLPLLNTQAQAQTHTHTHARTHAHTHTHTYTYSSHPLAKCRNKCMYVYLSSVATHLSAPAHDNILLILRTWKGWTLIRMWNWSLPQFFTMYLLAQIRAASRASLDSCSYSSETRWTQRGN